MKEAFDLLNSAEKKRLAFLGLLLAGTLVFFLAVPLKEKRNYDRSVASMASLQQTLTEQEAAGQEKKREWESWEETKKDLEELRAGYFYDWNEGIAPLRLDLQQILREAGVHAPQIKYDYAEFEKERVRKISATFHFTGSYFQFKRFLDIMERFPKFLVIEKIDFVNIRAEGGVLELKIVLAGYYES